MQGACRSGRRDSVPGNRVGSVWKTREVSWLWQEVSQCCGCKWDWERQREEEVEGHGQYPLHSPGPQLGQEDETQELRGVNVSGQKEKLKGVTCPRREYQ